MALLISVVLAFGQTNPAAQALPYSHDFSGTAHSSTTYPAGWQGWTISTSPGSAFNTAAPTTDRALTASSHAGTTSGNVHNYDGKIGYLNTGSLDLTLALALNTTGMVNIQVSYDIMTIRNPHDGSANTRINEVTLQYRIGTTGAFTTLTGVGYQNNTTTQTTGTTPQNLQTRTITLPAECNNQAVVQIRWASRQVSGSGSRPSFAVDNISVTGSAVATPMIVVNQNLSSFTAWTGYPSAAQTYTLSGSNLTAPINIIATAPFQVRVPGGTWGLTAQVANTYNGSMEVRYNPVSAGTHNGTVTHTSTGADNQVFNVSGTATDPTPTIQVSPSFLFITSEVGQSSAPQSFNLTSQFLATGISVASSGPYTFASSELGTFTNPLALAQNYNGSVWVKFTPPAAQAYTQDITVTSGAAQAIVTTYAVGEVINPNLLLEENFNYPAGNLLTNHGWTAHSGAGTQPMVVGSTGLTYPNYPSLSGNSAQTVFAGSAEDIHRTFTPQTSGDVYLSALINISSIGSTTGDYVLHLGPSPIGTDFKGRLYVQRDAVNNIRFGVTKAGAVAAVVWTDYIYSYDTTYLVVMKYTLIPGAANDEVKLWINPVFSGGEPGGFLSALSSEADVGASGIGSVAIRQGTATPICRIDGIRVATSWTALWATEALDPTIIVTGILDEFISIAGSPSEIQSYHLRGVDLLTGITVTAPTGYELSTNQSTWHGVLSLPSGYDALVFVRLNAPVAGGYAGFITHTSGTAERVDLRVDGVALVAVGEIIATHALQTFYSIAGVPTNAQTVSVETLNLTEPLYAYLSVAAPFQIRSAATLTWTDFLELDNEFTGDIEVRFNPTVSGTFNATLFFASDGAATIEIPLTGISAVSVGTIAELRGLATGSTVYTLTGEAVLTFQQTFRNQKYIQDTTAAILIDDNSAVITTAYNHYDGITGITSTLGTFGGMLQFVPIRDPGAATSTGNTIIPQQIVLGQLLTNFEDYESELVEVLGVSFNVTGNFANGTVYPMTDGVNNYNFRTTFFGVNYINTEIPTVPKNIVGIPNSRAEGNFFTARFLSDFRDVTVPNPPTKLAITNINPASPFVNAAFSVSVQAQDDNGVPRVVTTATQVTLSVANGTGILSGTVVSTILQNTGSVTISGVLYSTAEAGVSLTATATSGMVLTAGTSAAFTVQSIPAEPTVTVLSRPSYVDISTIESQSAVLMRLQAYPTDDVRYRLFSGSFQYNCWSGTEYVSSTSYSAGPAVPGTATTSTSWWILYQRGNNNSTAASYRDRLGPGYTTNYRTQALPAATAITSPFTVNMTLPLTSTRYPLTVKYVVLGYDAETGGTLLTATSSALTTGQFSLVAETGTIIRRIEVRTITNDLMESITGVWDSQGSVGYYAAVVGLTGNALRAGLRTITSTGHVNNSWDASRYHLYATLDNVNNQVRCIYTGAWFAHPAGGQFTPVGLSAEHSYSRDWFTGHAEYNWCDTDLNTLFPADINANSSRSFYPFDYVTTILTPWGSGSYLSYRGNNASGHPVFEAADEFKGNIARAIFYFGMRYYDDNANFLRYNVNLIPILKQWHALDPVDAAEIARNNGVFAFQANRNPFIDHPEWIESIWGAITVPTPVATAATAVDDHGFTANWEATAGATSYRIDISTSPTFAGFVNGRKNVVVSGTSYVVGGLYPNTNYYYRVRALDAGGNLSLHSNTINLMTTVGGEVIYYWNFNDNVPVTGANWTQPIPANIGNGNITYDFTVALSFGGTTLNGITEEVIGGSLVPQPGDGLINNGRHFEVTMPTIGYQDIVFSYVTRGTTTGFNTQTVQYSTNGVDFITKVVFTAPLENNWVSSQIRTVDFSDVPATDNNPNFKVRIVLTGGTFATGNNRFDNIKIFGTPTGAALDPPQNVQISIVGANVQITWNAVTGATGYRIEASNDPYGIFTPIDTIGAVTLWSTAVSANYRFYRVVAIR